MRRLPHPALRALLLAAGLVVMAFGVAFSIKAELGTSPISSLPYLLSRFTPLSVGTATIALHITLILLQILLLRRDYQPLQLLQLPVALLFGVLTDIAIAALSALSCSGYFMRWVFCAIGILLVGLGVSLEVLAGLVTLAGEGMALAICRAFSAGWSCWKSWRGRSATAAGSSWNCSAANRAKPSCIRLTRCA